MPTTPVTATPPAADAGSIANTELIRSVYASFATGDLAAVLSRLSADVAWLTPATLPWSRGDYVGVDQVAEYLASFLGHLAEPAIVPSEIIDAGDRVVVHGHERGRAATTGRAFSARFTHTWTVREGSIREMRGVVDTAAICECFDTTDATHPGAVRAGSDREQA